MSRPDRPWQDCDRPENFCSIALGRDAIARAGGRFELPAVLEYRLRSGFGDDKPEFQFGFSISVAFQGTEKKDF